MKVVGAFLLVTSATGIACGTPDSIGRSGPTQLTVGMPEGIADGGDSGVRQVARNLAFEGLTQMNEAGRVMPWLAERWAWQDARTLRVTLPANLEFHDGTKLTAPLVADLLTGIVARGNPTLFPTLGYVTAIRPDGEREVVFELSEPTAFLPEDLEIPIVTGDPLQGTGPFRIVQSSPREYTLTRFDKYRQGAPAIDRVVVKAYETLRNAWTAMLRREVDMVTEVPPDAVEFVGSSDVQLFSFARRYQYLMAFNSARGPLQNPAVRRALNLAVDRAGIVTRVLRGHGTVSAGPIWPKYWAHDPDVAGFRYDPAAAETLLDSAGLPRAAATAGSGSAPPSRFRFTCLIPADFAVWERVGLEVQKNLYAIGVDMQFELVPFAQFDTRIRSGGFDSAIINMISGPTPGRAFVFWRSPKVAQGLNVFGWENAEAERLYDALRLADNDAATRVATGKLQRTFLDDPPALFIAWDERTRAVSRRFSVPEAAGRDPMQTLSRWTSVAGTAGTGATP